MKPALTKKRSKSLPLILGILFFLAIGQTSLAQESRSMPSTEEIAKTEVDREFIHKLYRSYPDNEVVARAFKLSNMVEDENTSKSQSPDQITTWKSDKSIMLMRYTKAYMESGFSFEESFELAKQEAPKSSQHVEKLRKVKTEQN